MNPSSFKFLAYETFKKALHRDNHVKYIIKWGVRGTDSKSMIHVTFWQGLEKVNHLKSILFCNITTVAYLSRVVTTISTSLVNSTKVS